MPAALFDSYLIVDWSAAGAPCTGENSVWVALAGPEGSCRLWNPPTRSDAEGLIAQLLANERDTGRRALAGFDFPFGYPCGAARLLTGRDDWSALWELICEEVHEGPQNTNNRFDAAARLNARVPAEGPFYGNGLKRDIPGLPRQCPNGYGRTLPHRRRLIERKVKGAQETWKLIGNGSVGSQALVGIAALQRLRRRADLGANISVWPFEDTAVRPIVFAEIYPSLWPPHPHEPVKDAAQVRAVAEHFRALDREGELVSLLAVPEMLADDHRAAVVSEEAWMLGADNEGPQATKFAGGRGRTGRTTGSRRTKRLRPVAGTESMPLRYERDPAAIYRQSWEIVRAETRLDHLPPDLHEVAIRLVHACGMPDVANRLAWSADLGAAARTALSSGAPILCDCEAVASGIVRPRLPAANPVLCTLNDPVTPARAEAIGNTRSAAAIELWREHLAGALAVIGNAPTALFHLIELIDAGWPRPAAILAFPVGFVGAAESKAALARDPRGIPFLALRGRRGGSGLAAAAVNALAAGLEAPR